MKGAALVNKRLHEGSCATCNSSCKQLPKLKSNQHFTVLESESGGHSTQGQSTREDESIRAGLRTRRTKKHGAARAYEKTAGTQRTASRPVKITDPSAKATYQRDCVTIAGIAHASRGLSPRIPAPGPETMSRKKRARARTVPLQLLAGTMSE